MLLCDDELLGDSCLKDLGQDERLTATIEPQQMLPTSEKRLVPTKNTTVLYTVL